MAAPQGFDFFSRYRAPKLRTMRVEYIVLLWRIAYSESPWVPLRGKKDCAAAEYLEAKGLLRRHLDGADWYASPTWEGLRQIVLAGVVTSPEWRNLWRLGRNRGRSGPRPRSPRKSASASGCLGNVGKRASARDLRPTSPRAPCCA